MEIDWVSLQDSIGWGSSFCLAICALPLAITSVRSGKGFDRDQLVFGWLWLLGEILGIFYVLWKFGLDYPLLANYTANIIFLSIVFKYTYRPRVKA